MKAGRTGRGRALIAAALAGVALGTVAAGTTMASAATLDTVKQRGQLICGSNPGLPGFGQPNAQGEWSGLDVDYCRGIAAAVLGDPTKVKFVPLNATDRFPALQTGEVDVLVRNTTWTLTRDTKLGFNFGAVNFYDGQGFLVRKSENVTKVSDLAGASICTQQGTSTELNLADYFRFHKLQYQVVIFKGADEALQAYDSGRCDSFTDDSSGLAAERLKLTNPDDNVVLSEIISKEPLGPAVRQGDDQWGDIVDWVHYAMVDAEELGVTKANVDDMLKSDRPDIRRLLGVEGGFGGLLGLDDKWAYNVIKAVGNYGESFDHNVGAGSPLKIPRGLNNLWSNHGLQYSPPVL